MVRGASGDVTVDPSRLTFTTSTWNKRKRSSVEAGQDDDAEPDAFVTLTTRRKRRWVRRRDRAAR